MNNNIDIDFGDNKQTVPLENRKSISILLGAGFSVPMGYPSGNKLNESLLHFDNSKCSVDAYSGVLTTTTDYSKSNFDNTRFGYQKYFELCLNLIKKYEETHKGNFDYEVFYDFIKGDEVKNEPYQSLFVGLIDEGDTYENCLYHVSDIYNQMIACLINDRNGKTWYDDEPTKLDYCNENYDTFIKYLSALSKEYIVNVHTLNHDLLFESFKNTTLIDSRISDGFEELDSKYYGKLNIKGRTYHCRLERYIGKYDTPIRLYKLHGSLDYVHFHRSNGLSIEPDKYVKIKYGIGYDKIMKENDEGTSYDEDLFETHADFLTGTTAKMKRYNEPFFKNLMGKFEENLKTAEELIIIGYGCKDQGINNMIKENFNFKEKPSFIIDPYPSEAVNAFSEYIGSKILEVGIDKLDINSLKLQDNENK